MARGTAAARNTAGTSTYGHHCTSCKSAVTAQCWKKGHVARCEEPTCREVFATMSKTGCSSHMYADGYNLSAKKIKCGLPADHRTEWELKQEAEIAARRLRAAGEMSEAAKREAEAAAIQTIRRDKPANKPANKPAKKKRN